MGSFFLLTASTFGSLQARAPPEPVVAGTRRAQAAFGSEGKGDEQVIREAFPAGAEDQADDIVEGPHVGEDLLP